MKKGATLVRPTPHPGPPRLARWLMGRLSGWGDEYGAVGDFEEFYGAIAAEQGIRAARRACWKQVAAALPGHLKNVIIWSHSMLKHYFRIATRNLWKHKGYSFLNLAGLAVGMACVLFILLWVQDELSYDRFHAGAGTLYRVEQQSDSGNGVFRHSSMPYPLGPVLKAEIPEIEDAVRIADTPSLLARSGEKAFFEEKVRAVDPQFFRMFTFPLLKGDPATALTRPGSLVITQETAKRYFGAADAMGKTVTFNDAHPFTVTGVMKDVPENSSFSFDMLVPFDFLKTLGAYSDSFTSNDILTFIRAQPRGDLAAAGRKITRLVYDRSIAELRADPEHAKMLEQRPQVRRHFESRVFLFRRLIDIHLFGEGTGAIRNVYLYSLLALFILLIACLNFMSLATARSANRAKEVGMRRVVGARRKSLIGQFYAESILTALLAGVAALLLVIPLFPAFNALAGKEMSLGALWSGKFLLGILGVILVTGIVAGSYPALFLSSFRPVKVLRGRLGAKGALFRKATVLFQFGLSILFLIGLGVMLRQVDHMRTKELGYDKEQLIYLPLRDKAPLSYAAFKGQLLRSPRVLGVTATRHPPTSIYASDTYADWDGKDPEAHFRISFASVDLGFSETMKIPMVAGRPFSRDVPSDVRRAWLVNESLAQLMGLDAASAVGRRFSMRNYEGTIVGVMKDFHYQSVRQAIAPLAVIVDPAEFHYAVVRLTAGQIPASLEDVRRAWRQVYPQYPIEYRFFDEDFDRMYQRDERMGEWLKVFAGMAVFIACMGLFGLASYTAEQRTKEIGVRKVLGASSPGIVLLLTREFAKWVLAANVLAWPAAYFLMKKWLEQFAYRTGIAWWLFAAAGAGALVIALATVSFQAVRASRIDPAVTLKYE